MARRAVGIGPVACRNGSGQRLLAQSDRRRSDRPGRWVSGHRRRASVQRRRGAADDRFGRVPVGCAFEVRLRTDERQLQSARRLPPSWMQANSAGSCPQAQTAIETETCDGMYRWSLLQGGSEYMPGDGTLVAVCYYDMSTGLLAGIDSQITLPCGSTSNQFGTVPQWCHYDAGVAVQRFVCSSAGSGQPLDGGTSVSCSQEMPCHGGG